MQKFRKVPDAEVEARQLNLNDHDDACSLVRWTGGTAEEDGILIRTLVGPVLVRDGEVIIKDHLGRLFVCGADGFNRDYEPVPCDEISPARLRELEVDSAKLHALYAGGVDNWEGYSDAMDALDDTGDVL